MAKRPVPSGVLKHSAGEAEYSALRAARPWPVPGPARWPSRRRACTRHRSHRRKSRRQSPGRRSRVPYATRPWSRWHDRGHRRDSSQSLVHQTNRCQRPRVPGRTPSEHSGGGYRHGPCHPCTTPRWSWCRAQGRPRASGRRLCRPDCLPATEVDRVQRRRGSPVDGADCKHLMGDGVPRDVESQILTDRASARMTTSCGGG